jgi:hypothetical protein
MPSAAKLLSAVVFWTRAEFTKASFRADWPAGFGPQVSLAYAYDPIFEVQSSIWIFVDFTVRIVVK